MPVVNTKQGKIKGKDSRNYHGDTFHSFQGIPYAKPPTGPLRFQAPQDPESWEGVKDCTKDGSECFSRDYFLVENVVGSEDCLVLNVYTPKLPCQGSSLLPVMFWIHGGGFITGSSHSKYYGPEYLMTAEVVLVTINYRLGAFGCLSFEDPSIELSENNGFKDMVMALKWVQENIKSFNGDPENVTISGESAGSAATHLLILSPLAKGLFHKAIMQSGCALNPWVPAKRCGKDLAEALNLRTENEVEIFETLKTLPGETILEAEFKTHAGIETDHPRCYGYVVERNPEGAFMPKHPLEVMKSGDYNKVPMIIGYNNKEGIFCQIWQNNSSSGFRMIEDFETKISFYFGLEKGSDASKRIAKRLQEFYFSAKQPSMDMIDKFYDLETDRFFLRGIYQSVKHHVRAAPEVPIYFYRFSIDHELNFYKKLGKINNPGAAHSDDLGYLFKTCLIPDVAPGTAADRPLQTMVRLWSNFARTGNPNPIIPDTLIDAIWKPVKQDRIYFLDIGDGLTGGEDPDKDRMDFWDEITSIAPAAQGM